MSNTTLRKNQKKNQKNQQNNKKTTKEHVKNSDNTEKGLKNYIVVKN